MSKTDGRSSVARAIAKATKALEAERQKSAKLALLSSNALELAATLNDLAQAEHELRNKPGTESTSRIVEGQRIEARFKLRALVTGADKLVTIKGWNDLA